MGQITSFEKKLVRKPFRAIKQGLLVLLIIGGLFLFSEVKAKIFTDDFETCDFGSLPDGNCGWIDGSDNHWIATSTSPYSGSKAIFNSSEILKTSNTTYKWASTTYEGDVVFYVKMDCLEDGETQNRYEFALLGTEGSFRLEFSIKDYDCVLANKQITLKAWNATEYTFLADISAEIYHKIKINFATSTPNYHYRVQIDDGTWSDWFLPTLDWIYGLNRIAFLGTSLTYHALTHLWIDNINPPECSVESCYLCETYGTCVGAGCVWWYSIFLQQSFCVDYFEAEEEKCGSFFKCQFCTTQELCEAELNCEWINIGFGDKCYLIEPTIPPEQVAWEMPDCEGLGTLETWLCENFVPSQEKFNELFSTIGALKEKFPFNYANELNYFFDDISASIDVEKSIPIKILGQESEVSFVFWNSTTTIGGQEETLKNVVLDFTSIVIFMGWFVWLISLIRRFFPS